MIIIFHLLLVGSVNQTSDNVHLLLVGLSSSILEKEHTVNIIMHVEPVISLNELKDAIEHKSCFISIGSMTEDFPFGKPEPPLHQSFFNCVFTEHLLIFLRQGHMFLAAILEHIMFQRHYLYLMTARIRSFNKLLKLPAILSVQKMNFPAQSRHQKLYIKVADHRFA